MLFTVRCDETPYVPRAHHAHCTNSKHERRVTGRFAALSVRLIGRIQHFLRIQLKTKYVFQCGAHEARCGVSLHSLAASTPKIGISYLRALLGLSVFLQNAATEVLIFTHVNIIFSVM